MIMNAVGIKDLSVKVGEKEILSKIDLVIPNGSITCIVGPSGAGKSTLLRTISFLEKPVAGEMELFGERAVEPVSFSLRRRLSFVSQTPYLLDGTVLANVCYPLWVRGILRKERIETGMKWLNKVGLKQYASRQARSLSGGEAQRLSLARALAAKPDLLLLDEVTAHLDPGNVKFIEALLLEINSGGERTTIVLASHNLYQAKRLAGQVALIIDGVIVEVSKSADFFETPADARTKEFLAGTLFG